jgi:hypothetical protein
MYHFIVLPQRLYEMGTYITHILQTRKKTLRKLMITSWSHDVQSWNLTPACCTAELKLLTTTLHSLKWFFNCLISVSAFQATLGTKEIVWARETTMHLGISSWLWNLQVTWPPVSFLNSLNFHFFTCNAGKILTSEGGRSVERTRRNKM